MANVTVIPATRQRHSAQASQDGALRRTAAYARVSTDSEEQLTSYEAQVDYYTRYIKERVGWEFSGIYTDEGISATSTSKRDGFNSMVADALDGKIDLIVTKSVSRFARNTVDSLVTVRKLKEKGVEVYFEKENIYTLDSKGELLITIMSSLAQEESRSISENVTWGQRKRFADGKVSLPYKRFLGYDKGDNGLPVVNEEEAVTVRLIYRLFLEGGTPHSIAKKLTQMGIHTPGGCKKWFSGTVKSILTNEKYKGDALLQKCYTVDFLTKKRKVNEGEVPQYYVENSHPAIIDPEAFDMAQAEMKRRTTADRRHSGNGMFSSRIVCGECGAYYGSKVWHSTSKYRRTIYQCNSKFKGDEKCGTPHLDEETIKTLFVKAVNKLLSDKDEIIASLEMMKERLFDTSTMDAELGELQSEIAVTAELIQKCVDENARTALDQSEYQNRYDGLVRRYEETRQRKQELEDKLHFAKARCQAVAAFINGLKKQDGLISEFDERLWYDLLDFVTVHSADNVRFTFKDDTEI
jgi:DNA invertase Pin-like site-specific DNA recombinase/regulator of replication initiation timing